MIKVAAAIIEQNGQILVFKRGAGGVCEFLWEFAGGKLEEGESPNEALVRECREELDIEVEPVSLYDEFSFDYPDRTIYFYFIRTKIISGDIKLNVHLDMKWIKPEDMIISEFCPADEKVIKKLMKEYTNGNNND